MRRRPVHWSREALDDLKEQLAFIGRDNPAAARRIADSIQATAAALGEMPIGRPGRVTGIYEKPITRLPYILAYALRTIAGRDSVVILRVIHTSRNWPPEEWPE